MYRRTGLHTAMAAPDPLLFLGNLVRLYVTDVSNYYRSAQAQKGSRSVPRFNYTALSRKVFDDVPAQHLHPLYIGLFDISDIYALQKGTNVVLAKDCPQSHTTLRDLILNVILPYQLPHNVKKDTKQEGNKKVKIVQVPPRVTPSIEEAKQLFSRFLTLPLPFDTKLWRQMRFILMPDRPSADVAQLEPIAREAIRAGVISFAALSFLMTDSVISAYFDPGVILHGLYIGPLKASTIESFASNKSVEFRRLCREMITSAEWARKDEITFARYRPNYIAVEVLMCWNYKSFCENIILIVNDMKGLKRTFTPISPQWAYAAIKKFGKRAYNEKTWRDECFYDLIWTIIVQRPHMKKFICDTLERDFHDYGAAGYWRRMRPEQMNRTRINNRNEVVDSSLNDGSQEFLNFPAAVKGIHMIDTARDLIVLRGRMMDEVAISNFCLVGLDAEWSAFTGESKASILQIALRDNVYIVDIDATDTLPHDDLRDFFHFMFMNPQIIKIGFQFAEDLTQLRSAVVNCRALFQPENVVCVGKMIADLLEETEKRENGQLILAEICPNLSNDKRDGEANEGSPQDDNESHVPDETEAVASNSTEKTESATSRTINKGLSTICEQVLGRPLDKREQCSVWDRRPLRSHQMRYAAMDAYCLLMLFDSCVQWTTYLGTSIDALLAHQPPMRSSLPLYSDDQ